MYTSEADFKGACKALHMGTRVPMEVAIVIKGTAADFVITRVIWLLKKCSCCNAFVYTCEADFEEAWCNSFAIPLLGVS